jgi:hypothetical protein
MTEPPMEHKQLLNDIDRAMSEATDEATRRELAQLKQRLSSPEMLEIAREMATNRDRRTLDPVLEFHVPLVPMVLSAAGGVIATAVCLFAVADGLKSPVAFLLGKPFNPWVAAAVAGAFAVAFAAVSLMRSFSVRCDTTGMTSRAPGKRYGQLRVGAMRWEDIRSLVERAVDGVLEVHAAEGKVLDIPMRITNYPALKAHLDNMVRLYGEMGTFPVS